MAGRTRSCTTRWMCVRTVARSSSTVGIFARRLPSRLMTYRVIQWATGTVGVHAVPAIAAHPDLSLVGLWVHSDSKAGRDAGEICGIQPVGVIATQDGDALIESEADCVCYTANSDLRPGEVIADIC